MDKDLLIALFGLAISIVSVSLPIIAALVRLNNTMVAHGKALEELLKNDSEMTLRVDRIISDFYKPRVAKDTHPGRYE